MRLRLPLALAFTLACGVVVTALPGQAPPNPNSAPKRLLAIGDTRSGFQHDSVSHALAIIDRLGYESGVYVTYLRTDSQLLT